MISCVQCHWVLSLLQRLCFELYLHLVIVTALLQSPAPSPQQSPQLDKRDIPLMSRLHARIKDLEKDKARLIMALDRRDYRSEILKGNGEHSDMEIYDALRVNNRHCCVSSYFRRIHFMFERHRTRSTAGSVVNCVF